MDLKDVKGIEPLSQTLSFEFLYLRNPIDLRYFYRSMNSIWSNNLSLKYQWFSPSGCQDIEIGKFELVTKTITRIRKTRDFKTGERTAFRIVQ